MEMIKMVDQLQALMKDYRNGYITTDAQVQVAQGFVLTGLFPKQEVTGKNVNIIKTTAIDKFEDKTGKMRKMAKGTKARRIVGEVAAADGLTLTHNEIEYIIESDVFNEETYNVNEEIGAMCYILAQDIEGIVYDKIVANASLSPTVANHDWDGAGTTLEMILADIIDIEDVALNTPYDINWLAYGRTGRKALLKKAAQSVEDYMIPQNQFPIKDSISLMNSRHFYGGREMGNGEILGGDTNNPGLKVFYKRFRNPNVKQAVPLPQGMADFAPALNVLIYNNQDTETEPQTFIKVACAVGAYPIQDGAGLLRYADITA
jgi:hypothetical protein